MPLSGLHVRGRLTLHSKVGKPQGCGAGGSRLENRTYQTIKRMAVLHLDSVERPVSKEFNEKPPMSILFITSPRRNPMATFVVTTNPSRKLPRRTSPLPQASESSDRDPLISQGPRRKPRSEGPRLPRILLSPFLFNYLSFEEPAQNDYPQAR